MSKEKYFDELLDPEENEGTGPSVGRGRARRRQRVDPDERDDYQEWLEERRDPKRKKPNQRKRREDQDLETGF